MQLRAQYIQEFYQTVRDKWWVTSHAMRMSGRLAGRVMIL